AGSQYRVLCGVRFGATIRCFDLDLATLFDFGRAHDHIDFVFLHQKLDALAHAVGNTTATFYDGPEIGLATIYLDAIICGMVEVLKYLRTLEQGFGGDTAPIEADAS